MHRGARVQRHLNFEELWLTLRKDVELLDRLHAPEVVELGRPRGDILVP